MFVTTYPALAALNIMRLHTPESAILAGGHLPHADRHRWCRSRFAAVVSPAERREYAPEPVIYGIGGIIAPFPGIWVIDQLLVLLHLV
jgi:K+-transporting ATPase ATPase B chain